MPGRQHIGAKLPGRIEEVGEFDVLVAGDAGDRRLARDIAARERLDHLFAKPRLVIEHVMGNAELGGDVARVVNVLSRAAGALAVDRRAVVVKLQGDADDVIALACHQRGDDRGIDAARHGHDDARLPRRLGEAKRIRSERRLRDLARACQVRPGRSGRLSRQNGHYRA